MASRRAALLVIHGIGEQHPYQALDAFARGLASHLQVEREAMEHRLAWGEGRTGSTIRLTLPGPTGRAGAETLDLCEFYWASLVQGRIGLLRVLAWVCRTSLIPLRGWSRHPEVLFRERGALRRPAWILLRELLRAAALLAVAAVIVLPYVFAASHARVLIGSARGLARLVIGASHPVALVCWLAVAAAALMILDGWRRLLRRRRDLPSIEQHATRWWRRASLAAFLVLLGVAWALHAAFDLQVPALLFSLWAALRPAPVLAPILAALIALLLVRPLVKHVGDIALYVSADERSSFFRTRAEILEGATRRLKALLADPEYTAVYIAGHSLGSVIGYDAINHLVREVRAEPEAPGKTTAAQLDRLRGLLTFGSPLDKVYHFFRTEVGEEEAVRAQVLASLHGFRKRPSGRDYGRFKLAPYAIPRLPALLWVNVHAVADPVSGYLDFYVVDRQSRRPYWNPAAAHLAYWNDPGFYEVVGGWL